MLVIYLFIFIWRRKRTDERRIMFTQRQLEAE